MKKISTFVFTALLIASLSLIAVGCVFFTGASDTTDATGTVSLSLTDAPIADAADIEGVFITIESIAYNLDDEWVEADSFTGPQTFNLLDLTGGTVAVLGDTEISAGTVTQIRFMLSAPEQGAQTSGNPGCFIAIDPDGTREFGTGEALVINPTDSIDDIVAAIEANGDVVHSLFVPSGGQTGYKAEGPFTVPTNGTVEITADFDVRQSVVYAGPPTMNGGFYLLKPTIDLIVNNQAGNIAGSFVDDTTNTVDETYSYETYVIFAYADDMYATYTDEDTAADDQSAPFPNAVGSANAVDSDDDGILDSYTIAFLAHGTYDLIIAGVDAEGAYTVVDDTYVDIVVQSETTTTQNINIDLTPTL